ncbi:hypothetical protein THAOC_35392, partial [Thalassiosira oceanica]
PPVVRAFVRAAAGCVTLSESDSTLDPLSGGIPPELRAVAGDGGFGGSDGTRSSGQGGVQAAGQRGGGGQRTVGPVSGRLQYQRGATSTAHAFQWRHARGGEGRRALTANTAGDENFGGRAGTPICVAILDRETRGGRTRWEREKGWHIRSGRGQGPLGVTG